jgi:cell division protein FtsZ
MKILAFIKEIFSKSDNTNIGKKYNFLTIPAKVQKYTPSTSSPKISLLGMGSRAYDILTIGLHKINIIASDKLMSGSKEIYEKFYSLDTVHKVIHLGDEFYGHILGADQYSSVGYEKAMESYDEILSAVEGSEIVFVFTDLSQPIGAGAIPVGVKAAKESGAFVISIVYIANKAFSPYAKAIRGLRELQKVSDVNLIIEIAGVIELLSNQNCSMDEFRSMENMIIRNTLNRMIDIVTDISAKESFTETMKYHGLAVMGSGQTNYHDNPINALEDAIQSPLMNGVALSGAKAILVHIKIFYLSQVIFAHNNMRDILKYKYHCNGKILFETTLTEEQNIDVMIIATGFEE